jgi:6-phosphogluconolactonase
MVFAGGYAAADQPGIQAFTFDEASGALTPQMSLAGIANPSFLIVHPNRRWLYAVSELSQDWNGADGSVWALRIDHDPWSMQLVNQQPCGGDAPCHLALDASGSWLLVSNYSTGSVAVLPILPDGALGTIADLIEHHGSSVNPERQASPHAHSATPTPDGRFVIVADLGLDQLLVYAFDPATGKLGAHSHADTRPGAGPRHLAFHPNGRYLYVANELDSTISFYDYDPASGALRELQALSTLPAGAPESWVADIHVAPTGDRVYVSNRGHDSLAVFDIATDGQLALVDMVACGGACPRNFALAPGGGFVLVANQNSNAVAVLPLLAGATPIGAAVAQVAVTKASCLQFMS